MKFAVLALALFAASCSDDSGSTWETLLDEDFSTFPFGWTVSGADVQVDTEYGFPAPSGFVSGRGSVYPPDTFNFESQALDARVTAYMQNDQVFGEKYAVLRIVPPTLDQNAALVTVSYRLINNRMDNYPMDGYPAGNTAEIHCQLDAAEPVHVEVPYEDRNVIYELFVTIDGQGSRCGYDETVIATSATTNVTGSFRIALGATIDTFAWFDSLTVRRAD